MGCRVHRIGNEAAQEPADILPAVAVGVFDRLDQISKAGHGGLVQDHVGHTGQDVAARFQNVGIVDVSSIAVNPDFAFASRGDVSVVAVDTSDGGRGSAIATARDLVRRLEQSDVDAELVGAAGLGAAATSVDVLLVEALAASPDALLVERGSLAAASAAYCAGVPVWGVVGRGRVLPEAAFASVAERSTSMKVV